MTVFEKKGKENTEETLKQALKKADDLGAPIVVASITGYTADRLLALEESTGSKIPVIMVSTVYGMKEPGKNRLAEEKREELTKKGVKIVTAAHALSGAERCFSTRFHGLGPTEIMAHTLRMFSEGVKVCVECSTMALDAGAIPYGKPVVAVGGSAQGADSAMVLTPAYTQSILDTKIHEILCMPY